MTWNCLLPFLKGTTLKGNNLLPLGANSFLQDNPSLKSIHHAKETPSK